jgi:hypothetical protein
MSHKKKNKKSDYQLVILPAQFVEFKDDKVILDVRIEPNLIQKRLFDKILVENISNIKYVALGIRSGAGYVTINCTDANEYSEDFDKLFLKKV